MVRKCAEDSGIRFGFERVFVERISNAGIRSFGIVQLSGKPGEKPGEKRKRGKASVRGLEAR